MGSSMLLHVVLSRKASVAFGADGAAFASVHARVATGVTGGAELLAAVESVGQRARVGASAGFAAGWRGRVVLGTSRVLLAIQAAVDRMTQLG